MKISFLSCFSLSDSNGKRDLLKIALLLREANKISQKLGKTIVSCSLTESSLCSVAACISDKRHCELSATF